MGQSLSIRFKGREGEVLQKLEMFGWSFVCESEKVGFEAFQRWYQAQPGNESRTILNMPNRLGATRTNRGAIEQMVSTILNAWYETRKENEHLRAELEQERKLRQVQNSFGEASVVETFSNVLLEAKIKPY